MADQEARAVRPLDGVMEDTCDMAAALMAMFVRVAKGDASAAATAWIVTTWLAVTHGFPPPSTGMPKELLERITKFFNQP